MLKGSLGFDSGKVSSILCRRIASFLRKKSGGKKWIILDGKEMMRKEKVLETVKEFPAEFELKELIERLIFIENVEKGLKELDEGGGIPHEEVKQLVKSWRK